MLFIISTRPADGWPGPTSHRVLHERMARPYRSISVRPAASGLSSPSKTFCAGLTFATSPAAHRWRMPGNVPCVGFVVAFRPCGSSVNAFIRPASSAAVAACRRRHASCSATGWLTRRTRRRHGRPAHQRTGIVHFIVRHIPNILKQF